MIIHLKDLKKLRKKFYLMQYDICRYVGVSDVAYRTWEQRVRRPNEEHYKRLQDIFDILYAFSEQINSRESAMEVLDRELDNE